ncbi:MAG: hypothetical protein R2706_10290 [Acidimicrobiales bacterium]
MVISWTNTGASREVYVGQEWNLGVSLTKLDWSTINFSVTGGNADVGPACGDSDPADPLGVGGTTAAVFTIGSGLSGGGSDTIDPGQHCVIDVEQDGFDVQVCFESLSDRDDYLTSAGILDGEVGGKTTLGTHYTSTSRPFVQIGAIPGTSSLAVVGLATCFSELNLVGTVWDDVFRSTRNGCGAVLHSRSWLDGPIGPRFISTVEAGSFGELNDAVSAIAYLPAPPPEADGPERLKILVIGDSYSAGNSSRDSNGDRTYYEPDECYRSTTAWSELYADYVRTNLGIGVEVINRACSGGVTENFHEPRELSSVGLTRAASGTDAEKYESVIAYMTSNFPGCVSDAPDVYIEFERKDVTGGLAGGSATVVCHRYVRAQKEALDPSIDLVLFTFGGNDAFFGDIARDCLVSVTNSPGPCRDSIAKADDVVAENLQARIEAILREIETATEGNAKVGLLGYPHLEGNPTFALRSLSSYLPLVQGDYFPAGERVRALAVAGDVAQKAAADAVDLMGTDHLSWWKRTGQVKHAFAGHEPRTAGPDDGFEQWIYSAFQTKIRIEWYHPNRFGHIAEAGVQAHGDFSAANEAGRPVDVAFAGEYLGEYGRLDRSGSRHKPTTFSTSTHRKAKPPCRCCLLP